MAPSLGSFRSLADVSLGDLVFNTVDENGCLWTISDIDGWWGLPDPTLPDDSRPFSQDGNYLTTGRYGPRIVSLSGMIVPPQDNINAVVYARSFFHEQMNLVRKTASLVVHELDGPKTAEVQISGRPLTKIDKVNGVISFEVALRAVDPRKYSTNSAQVSTGLPSQAGGFTFPFTFPLTFGALLGSSGIATVNNVGTYDTNAVIRFDGPVINPVVEHIESGRTLSFNINLSTTDSLYLDLNERTITLNGQESRRGAMIAGSRWFTIAPGNNSLRFRSDDSSIDITSSIQPQMTVIYRSAWIF